MLRVVLAKEIELNFRSERQMGCSDLSALQNPTDMLCKPGVLGLMKMGIDDGHGLGRQAYLDSSLSSPLSLFSLVTLIEISSSQNPLPEPSMLFCAIRSLYLRSIPRNW